MASDRDSLTGRKVFFLSAATLMLKRLFISALPVALRLGGASSSQAHRLADRDDAERQF